MKEAPPRLPGCMLGLGGAAGAVRGLWPEAEDGESGIPDVEWLGGGRLPRLRDSARTPADLLQKCLWYAVSTASPGVPPSVWARPYSYSARTPAGEACTEGLQGGSCPHGWSSLSSQLWRGWASGMVLWAHPHESGCGSSVVEG